MPSTKTASAAASLFMTSLLLELSAELPGAYSRPAIAKAIYRATSEYLTLELVKNSRRLSSNSNCYCFEVGTSIAIQIGTGCS